MIKQLLITIAILVTIVLFFFIYYLKIRDLNCKDFSTQIEAQRVFLSNTIDRYHLDRDKDGIACEGLNN
jgi:hypothetical protein